MGSFGFLDQDCLELTARLAKRLSDGGDTDKPIQVSLTGLIHPQRIRMAASKSRPQISDENDTTTDQTVLSHGSDDSTQV